MISLMTSVATGYWMLDAGCWMLDTGCHPAGIFAVAGIMEMLVIICSILDA